VPEEELFKICLEFWKFFATDAMNKRAAQSQNGFGGGFLGESALLANASFLS
jgi:hypothetical protein